MFDSQPPGPSPHVYRDNSFALPGIPTPLRAPGSPPGPGKSGHRHLPVAHLVDVDVDVGPVALHRHDVQVPPEGAGVDPAERQPVGEPRHDGGAPPPLLPHLGELLRRVARRGEGVGPQAVHAGPRDAPALVADLDGDVLLPLGKHDRDGGGVLARVAVPLDGGAHRVLDQLEEDVVQVLGDVREDGVGRPLEEHLGRGPEGHVAHPRRVLDRVLAHQRGLAVGLDDADEPLLGVVQHDVLPDQDADPHAREVEAVQELSKVEGHPVLHQHPGLAVDVHPHLRQLLEPAGDVGLHAVVLVLDVLEHLGELLLELGGVGLGEPSYPEEGPLVQLPHPLDRRRVPETEGQLLQLPSAPRQPHW
mmetsp:Transcript_48732/g.121717  ORF Transcript_48732/g.121717 Transcript_48732/m.121717 type:complete len:361 (-) Transcript_48732:272-1354(-)